MHAQQQETDRYCVTQTMTNKTSAYSVSLSQFQFLCVRIMNQWREKTELLANQQQKTDSFCYCFGYEILDSRTYRKH